MSLYRKETGVVTECLGSSLSLEQAQGVLRTSVVCRGLQDSCMHFFHVMSVFLLVSRVSLAFYLSCLFRVYVLSPSLVFLYFFRMFCLPLAHSHPVYRVLNVHLSLLCVCVRAQEVYSYIYSSVRTYRTERRTNRNTDGPPFPSTVPKIQVPSPTTRECPPQPPNCTLHPRRRPLVLAVFFSPSSPPPSA